MLETTLIPWLTLIAGVIALGVFISYSIVARWWETRSGTAYWILFLSLILLAGHFVLEGGTPEGQAPVREVIVLLIVIGALLWNWFTIVYKQLSYRHDH